VSRGEHLLGLTVVRLVGVLMTLTAVGILVAPKDPNIRYSRPLVLAGLLLTAGFLAALCKVRARIRPARVPGWTPWLVGVLAGLVGGTAAVAVGHALRYRYGWDARVVTGFSRELSADGTLSGYAVDYLSRYPNNIPLVALMNTAHEVGAALGWDMYGTYLWFNGICLATAMVTTFAVVKKLRGTFPAFVAQGVVFVLMGLSPWMAVPYTDLPAAPLVLAGLGLALVALRLRGVTVTTRLLSGAAGLTLLALASLVKTIPATSFVALACVVLVIGAGARSARAWGGVAAIVTAGALLFSGVVAAAGAAAAAQARVDMQRLDMDRTPPAAWWLANGLTTRQQPDGRVYYGSYSPDMVEATIRLRGDELQRWSERELRRQLERGTVASLLVFEVDKQLFNWGDGMFFAWGEGYDAQPSALLDSTAQARWVQSWNHVSGTGYPVRASLTNGLWLFVVAWCGLGLLSAPYRRETLLLAVAILALTAFTLLFQGRSRYLFAYVPTLVVLAAVVDPLPLLRTAAGRLRLARVR
jgi:hypothetical protein